MILITGSTGQLGSATIDFLLQNTPATQIAALARDTNKATDLIAKGVDVRIGNYTDHASLVSAFQGVDKLLLISSSDMNDRAGQHINAINAAKEAGVKHMIYTSAPVKDVKSSAIPFVLEAHIETADYLKASGLNYTILEHNLYADVLPMFLGENVLEAGLFFPAGSGKVPYVTRLDMAEAAANVLTGSGHANKTYAIASGTSHTFADVAGMLSELSGKTIAYANPSAEVYAAGMTEAGVPAEAIGFLGGFGAAISNGEFYTEESHLEQLLGRKPTSLQHYLKSVYFPG
jgi:NAD(P)H dehydrogenase (quinone)